MLLASLMMGLVMTMNTANTFTNPVASHGADPWVIKFDHKFHYCFSRRGAVWVATSPDLLQLFRASPTKVYQPEKGKPWSEELWAPELHRIGKSWFIYVAADDGKNENHRMQVLRRDDVSPAGPFQRVGELKLPDDKWAIDGTAMQLDGKLYFIWSGWPGDVNETQRLYICAMSDPATPVGPRVEISRPDQEWELHDKPTINEGPEVLQHGGKTFILYSASGSWADHYCLGMLELVGKDPLKADAWKKHEKPAFAGTDEVISPGHASFTTSGGKNWIVYHAARHAGAGWDRLVRIQPFTYDEKSIPVFGAPLPPSAQIERPAPATQD